MKNKIKKEILWSFSSKATAFLLFFVINIFLARKLWTEKYWLWSVFFSVLTIFLTISYFWINSSVQKYAAEYNKKDELKTIIKNGFLLRVIFSFAFSIIFFLIYNFLDLSQKKELNNLWIFWALFIFLYWILELFKSIFMWLHIIKYNFILNFIDYFFRLVLLFILFSYSLSFENILSSTIISSSIAITVWLFIIYKLFNRKIIFWKSFYKEIFFYSLPIFIISLWWLFLVEIDIIMLSIFSNINEVWFYSVAKQNIVLLPNIPMAIAMWVMPIFAQKITIDNKTQLRSLFSKLLKFNFFLFSIISIFILFFSPYFIYIFYGIEFSWSIIIFQISILYIFMSSFSVYLSSLLDYQWLAKKRAINMLYTIALNIVLNLVLIPIYWWVGAIISTTISFLPYFILNIIEVKKLLK